MISPFRRGYLYFIETDDGRFIKIGFSVDPFMRLSALKTLMPGLRLIGAMSASSSAEGNAHRRWRRIREVGEWFRTSPELREWIMSFSTGRRWLWPLPDKRDVPASEYDAARESYDKRMRSELNRRWRYNESQRLSD